MHTDGLVRSTIEFSSSTNTGRPESLATINVVCTRLMYTILPEERNAVFFVGKTVNLAEPICDTTGCALREGWGNKLVFAPPAPQDVHIHRIRDGVDLHPEQRDEHTHIHTHGLARHPLSRLIVINQHRKQQTRLQFTAVCTTRKIQVTIVHQHKVILHTGVSYWCRLRPD